MVTWVDYSMVCLPIGYEWDKKKSKSYCYIWTSSLQNNKYITQYMAEWTMYQALQSYSYMHFIERPDSTHAETTPLVTPSSDHINY